MGRTDLSQEAMFQLRHEEWRKGGSREKSLSGGGTSRCEEESSRLVLGMRGGREDALGGLVGRLRSFTL